MSTSTKTWSVRDLKPGDEVAVTGPRSGYLQVSQVQRITPSGQIVLANGDRFNPGGRQFGRSDWSQQYLTEATDAVHAKVARAKMVDRLRRRLDKWEQLPTETLERIEAAFGGTEPT